MSTEDIIEIEFAESPIPASTRRQLNEITVRQDGCVWRVHKADPDPFPSRPHAHNVESGLKMHLGTGRLYFRTEDTGRSVASKHLDFIRSELERRGVELPPLARS
jgi:hypothetical protein